MTRPVLFDLDGTLVDTPNAIVENFTATLAALGVPAVSPEEIRATIGLPLEKAFAQLIGVSAPAATVEEAVPCYQRLYREQIVPKAKSLLYPGVADGLAELCEAGLVLAIATSKHTASAEVLLTAAGIRDHFAMVVGADAVTEPKPAAETGLLIAAELGHPAVRAIMVGDTTHDISMAHNAGMRSVAVTYGIHSPAQLAAVKPTWTVDDFPAAVDRILHAG
ncbi:HAD family hydrolase [Streptomyces sp. NPDC007346]|uniref:HAD family hydrolase n=1 Tax=Streptomyces sp. NPDC007346 TaxID=3154682 RepID=UPI003454EA90